ncbi:TfuA-like protein [Streptomyces sp. NPDC053079]|uniref:TfuA-like protein n=1 Tax=Streptomyces sp. NPDC053079 TaxID=3365697 RepID=UPI0037D56D10
MRPVVFLGPSLDRAAAARELDAEYLPPVARGDIEALLSRPVGPPAIGIVDGRFLGAPAISPKEVLRAVDSGVPVYGSSSMGALRAVECAPYGVTGVGRVFEAYASGAVDADDEVALVYDPRTLHASSEPLINLRFAVRAGVDAGRVDATVAERFLEIAKSLYFTSRTVPAVLRLLGAELGGGGAAVAELARFLAEEAPDTKREDALALLGRMRQDLGGPTEAAS